AMSGIQLKQRLRIFCAAELPEDVRARVVAHVLRLQEAAHSQLKISWERAEKLHLTLKFLGELELAQVEALKSAVQRAAGSVERFELIMQEGGAFPLSGNPRVLWLGLSDDTHRLARLQEQLEKKCAREGLPREARAFHPHITIARIRIPNAAARQVAKLHREMNFAPAPFTVNEVIVMQSHPGAGGSRYTPLSRHQLKTEAGE
ncbi:MAG: RNA 2',3'-cyclic phosphodiesterase, partial [Acidobacteria bacterium]|nr:RNA 2',3'-cyclic phosphodiesterase [Acidobacteriota bacterium]